MIKNDLDPIKVYNQLKNKIYKMEIIQQLEKYFTQITLLFYKLI